jgi:hypothetical protein
MTNGRRKGNENENVQCRTLSAWLVPHPTKWFTAKVEDLPFRRRSTSITPLEGHWNGAGDILWRPGIQCPFRIECKKEERWDLDAVLFGESKVWEWWGQAKRQAGDDYHPLLLFTRNRKPVYALFGEEVAQCLSVQPKFGAVVSLVRPCTGAGRIGERLCLCLLADLSRTDPAKVRTLLKNGTSSRRSTVHSRAS